jgi:alpha-mannosidase
VGAVRTARTFGRGSILVQDFVLRAGSPRVDIEISIEWRESERYLALDLPFDVRTDLAACEIQFGVEHRPTHTNTTWDDAKFEVCAHRWVDLSEGDAGVAVLNDGRYGHSVHPGPATPVGASRVRVSLLRATRFPDPGADEGLHKVTISLLPHGPGLHEVVAAAEALNVPLLSAPGIGSGEPPAPLVSVEDPRVQVSAVKAADDGSGDLVVRLWEATGNHVDTSLGVGGRHRRAIRCDLLEEPRSGVEHVEVADGRLPLVLRPFELVTLRLC